MGNDFESQVSAQRKGANPGHPGWGVNSSCYDDEEVAGLIPFVSLAIRLLVRADN
jgi:hypothetical protein